jgi:hypothetical protein
MNLVRRLKEEIPDLYIQGFHGTKEYGLWGFKGFDQHEAYWENGAYSVLYPDFMVDRLTASGMRFQSWWNQNFRFMPAMINHSVCHRMDQYCASPRELAKLFDHLGWKYAVMSGLAARASLTALLIPYDPDDIYGDYIDFINKWVTWSRKTFKYNKNSAAFGSQVVPGLVDGHAKIAGNKGFIFLCNSAPVVSSITFSLGEEIGLSKPGAYSLKEIYPREDVYLRETKTGKGIFFLNDSITVEVPQYQVLLFELEPEVRPLLFGISGKASLNAGHLAVSESIDTEGMERRGYFISNGGEILSVEINGTPVPFEEEKDGISFAVNYGKNVLPRYLYNWKDGQDMPFAFLNPTPVEHISLYAEFYVPLRIKEILETAKPKNAGEADRIIAKLRGNNKNANYAWAVPHRLYLVIPFANSGKVGSVNAFVNGELCDMTDVLAGRSSLVRYADITEKIFWGSANAIRLDIDRLPERQFIGAYLSYPEALTSVIGDTSVHRGSHASGTPVVFERLNNLSNLKPWYIAPEKQVRINKAWIQEGIIEEFSRYTLCADINCKPEELEGAYFSAQVCIDEYGGIHADEKLDFDFRSGLWTRTVRIGNRQYLIFDGQDINLWAVTKEGYVSPAYKLRLNWKLP